LLLFTSNFHILSLQDILLRDPPSLSYLSHTRSSCPGLTCNRHFIRSCFLLCFLSCFRYCVRFSVVTMSFCKSRISILGTLPHSLALVAQAQGCLTQIHHCFCNNNYKTNLSSPPPLSILTGWLPWRSPLPRPLHIASLFFVFTARRKYPCTLAHTVETRYAVRLILLVDFMTRSLQLWSGLIAPRLSTRSTEGCSATVRDTSTAC
jgi:hypothetical protein